MVTYKQKKQFFWDIYQVPVSVLLSVFVIGSMLDIMLGTTNTFKVIFLALGGIGLFVTYYKKILKKWGWGK